MTMTKPLATIKEPSTALTPMDMLDRALAQGANVEVMEKLMGLQERWETNNARKAYNDAIAQARAEIPVIFKANEKTGIGGSYKYEDLGAIARIIDPILSKHGLSYRFKSESNGEVRITCVITHRDGHSEENSLTSRPDTTGSKNAVQALGSAVTYLQRYTLKLALGIATSKDDDGESAGEPSQSAFKARKEGKYPIFEKEIRGQPSLEALKGWWKEHYHEIQRMPPQWVALLEGEKDRRKLELTDDGETSTVKRQLVESLKLTEEEKAIIDDAIPANGGGDEIVRVEEPSPGEYVEVALSDPDKYLDDLDGQMAGCVTIDDLREVWDAHMNGPAYDNLFPPDKDKAFFLQERHEARLRASEAVKARPRNQPPVRKRQ